MPGGQSHEGNTTMTNEDAADKAAEIAYSAYETANYYQQEVERTYKILKDLSETYEKASKAYTSALMCHWLFEQSAESADKLAEAAFSSYNQSEKP